MSPRRNTLTRIRSSFTGRDDLIERAFRDHKSFRDLCEDYVKCVAALDHWHRQPASESAPRRQEYSELLEELGADIETWLEAMETGRSHSSERSE